MGVGQARKGLPQGDGQVADHAEEVGMGTLDREAARVVEHVGDAFAEGFRAAEDRVGEAVGEESVAAGGFARARWGAGREHAEVAGGFRGGDLEAAEVFAEGTLQPAGDAEDGVEVLGHGLDADDLDARDAGAEAEEGVGDLLAEGCGCEEGGGEGGGQRPSIHGRARTDLAEEGAGAVVQNEGDEVGGEGPVVPAEATAGHPVEGGAAEVAFGVELPAGRELGGGVLHCVLTRRCRGV